MRIHEIARTATNDTIMIICGDSICGHSLPGVGE